MMFASSKSFALVVGVTLGALLFLALPAGADACGKFDLEIRKSGPATVQPNSTLTYTLTVSENVSGSPSTQQVVVTDSLPNGVEFISATITPDNVWSKELVKKFGPARCALEGQSVVCRIPQLDVPTLDTVTITITVRVPPALACSTLKNVATASSREKGPAEKDINRSNNTSATVKTAVLGCTTPTPTPTPSPTPTPTPSATPTPTPTVNKGLRVEKTDNKDLTRPGHSLTYVLTVENTGDVDLHDHTLTDNVPGQVSVTKIYDGGKQSGADIVWQFSLGAGEKKRVRFEARVKDNTTHNHVLHNKVTAESKDHDLKDSDTDDTLVQRAPVVAAAQTPIQVVAVPVTAKTGAGLLGLLATVIGGAGVALTVRRRF